MCMQHIKASFFKCSVIFCQYFTYLSQFMNPPFYLIHCISFLSNVSEPVAKSIFLSRFAMKRKHLFPLIIPNLSFCLEMLSTFKHIQSKNTFMMHAFIYEQFSHLPEYRYAFSPLMGSCVY